MDVWLTEAFWGFLTLSPPYLLYSSSLLWHSLIFYPLTSSASLWFDHYYQTESVSSLHKTESQHFSSFLLLLVRRSWPHIGSWRTYSVAVKLWKAPCIKDFNEVPEFSFTQWFMKELVPCYNPFRFPSHWQLECSVYCLQCSGSPQIKLVIVLLSYKSDCYLNAIFGIIIPFLAVKHFKRTESDDKEYKHRFTHFRYV